MRQSGGKFRRFGFMSHLDCLVLMSGTATVIAVSMAVIQAAYKRGYSGVLCVLILLLFLDYRRGSLCTFELASADCLLSPTSIRGSVIWRGSRNACYCVSCNTDRDNRDYHCRYRQRRFIPSGRLSWVALSPDGKRGGFFLGLFVAAKTAKSRMPFSIVMPFGPPG